MSKTVYKYPLPLRDSKFSLVLPENFKFLCVMFQNELPFMWAEVAEEVSKTEFQFQLFGTGQEIPESATYLTTYSIGPFVLHLYRL